MSSLARKRLFAHRGGDGPNARTILTRILSDGSTVANYQPGVGVTGTLNASAWANQIGAAGSLAQATGANQPIYLPFIGTKYAWFPAVAANTVTTPTKTITGNFTKTYDIALDDYTPAADVTIDSKTAANDGFTVKWLTTDKIRLVIGDGVGLTNVDVVAASSFADGTQHTFTIVWQDGVGATFFYDGVQSGSQVTAAKTLTNAAVSWTLGGATLAGKVYDHTMTNSASTTYYHLSPASSAETSTNAATWTSDNGEVYTLNNTGNKLAQIVGSHQLLFDGVAHFMATAGFTLPQPVTAYLVEKVVVYGGAGVTEFGGNGAAVGTCTLFNSVGSTHTLYGGLPAASNTGLAVNTYGIVTGVWNNASSSLTINSGAPTTGTVGTNTFGGLFLGAEGIGATPSNIQVKEIIVRNVSDSAAKQAQIQSYLKAIHGTP